ncbi:putative ribonuclease H-like domain-containing protein [Tanacetum coccineum]
MSTTSLVQNHSHAADGNGENAVKFPACWSLETNRKCSDHKLQRQWNHKHAKTEFDYVDLQVRLKSGAIAGGYLMKGIKREFSVARTPQQNGVAKRKNRTLIEAARTMLADSLLPTTFWAEAVNTACYVQNRVLVTKPHNKTPYELLHGRPPSISFMRPFGCPAFRVFNTRTRKVEENLHITFLENKPNVAGSGPDWLFDIDLLTNSMNYEPVTAGNQTNKKSYVSKILLAIPTQQYILLPFLPDSPQSLEDVVADDDGYANSTNRVSTVSAVGQSFVNDLPTDPLMLDLEDTIDLLNTGIFSGAYDEDVGAEADLNNLETTMNVSPIPTTRIHKDHHKDQIIGDINSATQTRRMTKISEEHAMVSYINKKRRTNHKDYQNCLFACFLSQIEPKKVTQALTDPSWIEAMQDELLQFRLQKVWRLVDLPKGKHAFGTEWVYRNKKGEKGIVLRNTARLVAQVKRIFRYLKGQPKLGLWYLRDSPFDLEAVLQLIMHELALTGNPQQEVVNFLAKGRITPLFASMLAPPVGEGEGSGQPTEPHPAPFTTQPIIEEQIPITESSSPQNTQTPRQALEEDT